MITRLVRAVPLSNRAAYGLGAAETEAKKGSKDDAGLWEMHCEWVVAVSDGCRYILRLEPGRLYDTDV